MKGHNILTIMKKEFRRFFGDRRMVMSIILPGILIYVVYSIMGSTLMESMMGESTSEYNIRIDNLSGSPTIQNALSSTEATGELSFKFPDENSPIADPKTAVAEDALDVYIILPEDFDAKVAAYDPASGQPAPAVEIYYNSSTTRSQTAYSLFVGILDAYESALANRMDINPDPSVSYDLAAPEDITGMFFSSLMPMLLIMLMFSGCMAMTTESIAGEKERGTIATLLVTPIKRSELAIGKIAALSLISLLAGMCSFVGILLSIPKLLGSEAMDSGMVDASVYSFGDYAMLLPVILSTILLFVALISLLSAYAGSVKEATGMVTPLMLLAMLVGISGMFISGERALWQFLIPVYNSVGCIGGIFSLEYTPVQILVTTLVNFVAAGGCVVILTRMFQSEKVMFKK